MGVARRDCWSPPCALLPTLPAHIWSWHLLAHRRVPTGSGDPTARRLPVKAALAAPHPRCVPHSAAPALTGPPPLVRSSGSRAWWTLSVKGILRAHGVSGRCPEPRAACCPPARPSEQRLALPRLVVTLPHGGLPSRSRASALLPAGSAALPVRAAHARAVGGSRAGGSSPRPPGGPDCRTVVSRDIPGEGEPRRPRLHAPAALR